MQGTSIFDVVEFTIAFEAISSVRGTALLRYETLLRHAARAHPSSGKAGMGPADA